ncbi:hypothetical protein ACTVH1_17300 [Gluconobacter cerinus]
MPGLGREDKELLGPMGFKDACDARGSSGNLLLAAMAIPLGTRADQR